MKKTVTVTFKVEVEIDEAKFDDAFMEEFRGYMYSYFYELDDHIEHLAQLAARERADGFIEGYGKPEDMGIKFKVSSPETEIVW